jgi:hypothetical protein
MGDMGERMKQFAANASRRLLGEGAQVDFEKEAKKLEKSHGITPEEAQSEIFLKRLDNVSEEIRLAGGIGGQGEGMRKLDGALRQLFDQKDLTNFEKMAGPDLLSRPKTYVDPDVFDRTRAHFETTYGKAPSFSVIHETAQYTKLLDDALQDFLNDPALYGAFNIKGQVMHDSVLQQKLGTISLLKSAIMNHEKRFARELAHEKRCEKLKSDSAEGLKTVFWKGPKAFLGTLGTMHQKHGFKAAAAGAVGGSIVLLPALGAFLTYQLGKFALNTVTAVGSGVRKRTAYA